MKIHRYIYTVERKKQKNITDINIHKHKYKQTHIIRTLNASNTFLWLTLRETVQFIFIYYLGCLAHIV